jgi:hypothetical protein
MGHDGVNWAAGRIVTTWQGLLAENRLQPVVHGRSDDVPGTLQGIRMPEQADRGEKQSKTLMVNLRTRDTTPTLRSTSNGGGYDSCLGDGPQAQ